MHLDPAYDIFKQACEKEVVFLERFRSLTQAEQHLASLGRGSGEEKYFIYGVRQGAFLKSLWVEGDAGGGFAQGSELARLPHLVPNS